MSTNIHVSPFYTNVAAIFSFSFSDSSKEVHYCSYCKRGYSSFNYLSCHQRIIHRILPTPSLLSSSFINREGAKKRDVNREIGKLKNPSTSIHHHPYQHSTYNCFFCNKNFLYQRSLHRHEKTAHPGLNAHALFLMIYMHSYIIFFKEHPSHWMPIFLRRRTSLTYWHHYWIRIGSDVICAIPHFLYWKISDGTG